MCAVLRVGVNTADVGTRDAAVSGRTIHEAVQSVAGSADSEARTVETVIVACSGDSGRSRGRVVSAA